MYVDERFEFQGASYIRSFTPDLTPYGEILLYRTYSRIKEDGYNESWNDIVNRVIEGVFSIRKDWYMRNHIPWDESEMQDYAYGMAVSMFHKTWVPPGRGLYAMGTDFVYKRGSLSLYNCAFTEINRSTLARDFEWIMDCLMCGVGVGFAPVNELFELKYPQGSYNWVIPDSREGWANSVRQLVSAFVEGKSIPKFDYSEIRPKGSPIRGFGGVASGPEPLMKLHQQIIDCCVRYIEDPDYNSIMFKTDIANMIGCCVIAGNVRRSAEIACGELNDPGFLDLKNYKMYPERAAHGWMSNNSVYLRTEQHFDRLGEIAERVKLNGEPGYINMKNLPLGRLGHDDHLKMDLARGFNPCGEIPLENKETCNLAETFPTICESIGDWYTACEYAAFYCSTVSLLPTHHPETNRVIAKNRRIGVSIMDVANWKHKNGVHKLTKWLRKGYKIVRATNTWLNNEAGVPESIRVTTMKPGGTVPPTVGALSGFGRPNFKYMIRRVRVGVNAPIAAVLKEAGYPYEMDAVSENTYCFEIPVHSGPVPDVSHSSLWEQAMMLVLLQREWADNAVSNTLNFRPKWMLVESVCCETEEDVRNYLVNYGFLGFPAENEHCQIVKDGIELKRYSYNPRHEEDEIESVLSFIAPLTKSVSLLPHTPKGVYKQMPEEEISENEYLERLSKVRRIDWTKLKNSEASDEKFCTGDVCSR